MREAIALRGRMDLSSYDRLFPAKDVLATGGLGNLIAAPLQGRCRRRGATVFLDLATLERHEDQWAYLSSLTRLSPHEVAQLAKWAAPRFPDSGIGAISCRTLPVQVLVVDFLRSPVAGRRMETSPIILGVRCTAQYRRALS